MQVESIIDELIMMEKDFVRMSDRISSIRREIQSKGEGKETLFELLFELLFDKSPDTYLMQHEVYGWLTSRLDTYSTVKKACEARGWVDGRRNNAFWRAFWRWMADQDGVERIETGRCLARFQGITRRYPTADAECEIVDKIAAMVKE